MIQNIFTIIVLVFISFIPIVIWWYLFSYLDDSTLNKKRFFIWILAWIISVFPVLYLDEIISKTNLVFLNLFNYVSNLSSFIDLIFLNLWFFSIILIFSLIPFFVLSLNISKEKIIIFFKNILFFSIFWVFLWILIYILNLIFSWIDFFELKNDFWLSFWEVLFNSIKLVIFYYIIIAFLEELSKFFCFNYSSLKINNYKEWVLYAMFVALGFSFLENILYFKNLYENYSFWKELISVYFSRNIFSLLLHVVCSSIFAYFFSIAYVKFKYKLNYNFWKILFIWFFLSIIIHAIFNISLSFNLTFMIFIYLIWWYFYLTYLFYEEE